jgi:hypothetical protein
VIAFADGKSGTHLDSGSSWESFFSSNSCWRISEVYSFVFDAVAKLVSSVVGTPT